MPVMLITMQVALAIGAAMLGGPATKPGGALLLMSIALFGVAAGWRAGERAKGGER